jgi:phosphoglucomutase
LDADLTDRVIDEVRKGLNSLQGRRFGPFEVSFCDDFSYHDPVDQSDTRHQGIRIVFSEGARIIYRLSGTGTETATLRVYLERFERDPLGQEEETQTALSDLAVVAHAIARIEPITGRRAPSVMT